MPTVDDWDQNDEEGGGREDGYTPAQAAQVGGSATGGAQQAPRQQSEPQSYVPWSSFASANQDVSQREAKKLEGQVQGDVSKAQNELQSAGNAFNAGVSGNYNLTAPSELDAGAPSTQRAAAPGTGVAAKQAAKQPAGASEAGGNPWEGFLGQGAAQTPATSGAAAQPAGAQQSWDPNASFNSLTQTAAGGALSGGKDIEAAAGQPAWSQLTGDTLKASREAHALGSEAGVQGLLQQNQPTPTGNSAFDAALINGQGQHDFGQLSQQYGNNQLGKDLVTAEKSSQDRWSQLQGEAKDAQRQKSATEEANATNSSNAAIRAAAEAAAGATKGADQQPAQWKPPGFENATELMTKKTLEDDVNDVGTAISPVDDIWHEIPGAGHSPTDFGNQYYSKQFGTAGAPNMEIRSGLGKVFNGWGQDAVDYWFSHLTPEMWDAYSKMNRADVAKNIEQWLYSTGAKPPSSSGGKWTPPPGQGGQTTPPPNPLGSDPDGRY